MQICGTMGLMASSGSRNVLVPIHAVPATGAGGKTISRSFLPNSVTYHYLLYSQPISILSLPHLDSTWSLD